MAVMTMSNVQLFSHGLFRISQYDKSVMNNQFLLFWFILEMLQTLTSELNQDVFDFHSSDTKKTLKVMIFISILIWLFVVARTGFSRHARRVRCNSTDFNWITTLSQSPSRLKSLSLYVLALCFSLSVLLSSFYFSPLSSQSSTCIIIRIIFRGHL